MTPADLAPLLSSFVPHDLVESDHCRRMVALTATPTALRRDHFDPGHFTASAFVLDPGGDRLLLIEHGKLHRWLQPGGHIEVEDVDVFAAARREVLEETGLDDLQLVHGAVLFDLDIHEIPPLKGEPAHAHFDLRILFRARSDLIQSGDGVLAAAWCPLSDVTAAQTDASVMRGVAKILRRGVPPGLDAPSGSCGGVG